MNRHTRSMEFCFELEKLKKEEYEALQQGTADCEDANEILAYIAKSGLLEKATESFASEYVDESHTQTVKEALADCTFMTARDWDRLVSLWVYDKETAFHAIRTHRILNRVLRDSPDLSRTLIASDITPEEEDHAAVLHDLGKIAIPRTLLNNTLTYNDTKELLFNMLQHGDAVSWELVRKKLSLEGNDMQAVQQAIGNHSVRPIELLPIQHVATPEELAELARRGFNTASQSYMDIIRQHERFSLLWLENEGPRVAQIAGHHHTPEESEFPVASSLLGTSSHIASELLCATDRIEAITAERSYKKSVPLIVALAEEVRVCNSQNELNAFVTYHILKILFEDVSEEEREISSKESTIVQEFLQKHAETSFNL